MYKKRMGERVCRHVYVFNEYIYYFCLFLPVLKRNTAI